MRVFMPEEGKSGHRHAYPFLVGTYAHLDGEEKTICHTSFDIRHSSFPDYSA